MVKSEAKSVGFDDPVYDDVMIDIETMSLHPHRATILSIGMIEFDASRVQQLWIGRRELLVPDFMAQLVLGRRVDPGTQEFWAEQSIEASRHWLEPETTTPLIDTIRLVREFCLDKKRVWANGTQFDLSNILGLAEDIGEKNLWHYQAPRDMRTFVRETEATRLVPSDALDIPGVPHEPIYDCIAQATQVWTHWRDH